MLLPALAGIVYMACSSENCDELLVVESNPEASSDSIPGIDSPLLYPFVGSSSVIISEVDPLNASYKDHEGGDAGWVELFNVSDSAVNLSGLSLADTLSDTQKWIFGDVVIPAHGYMLVFLSGKNLPDYEPPHDSVDLIGPGCWTWTDAQNDPPGFSYAEPLEGKNKVCFSENGSRMVGSRMRYGDNEKLGWASISVFVGTGNSSKEDVADISSTNEILLTAYVTKDVDLSVKLAQPDMDDWKGYEMTLVGTGDSSTTYKFSLPQNMTLPDLKNIYGTRFSPEEKESKEVTMKVFSYVARNRGHEPHASFKARDDGGSLYLMNADNEILDSVRYPKMPVGKSWNLNVNSDGASAWGFADPSPLGTVSGVVFSEQSKPIEQFVEMPPSGFYSDAFEVKFPEEAEVRCETGGFLPSASSPRVDSLIVSQTTVCRCASFETGKLPGEVESRTYIFEAQPTLPAVFLTGNPNSFFDADTGIYMEGPNAQSADPHYGANYWADREIPIFVELIEPDSKSPAFAENAGFQIFGNYSRMNKKKSVAVVFREKYGKKRLHYSLFPEAPELDKFKVFVLRTSNFGSDYIRDMLGSSITEGLGVDYQRGRSSIVFYNGEYYGIHNIRERSNEYYFETHYGMDPDEIDLIKADNSVSAGSSVDYVNLMEWLPENDLSDEENYKYVMDRIDIDNYLNYVQTEIFIDNRDWPANNMKKWRGTNPVTRWKWFLYDTDFGFDCGYSEYTNNIFDFVTATDGDSYPNGPEHTLLLRSLLENDNFRAAFINRMVTLLSMNFESSRVTARLNLLQDAISAELERDRKRWSFSKGYMDSQLKKARDFAVSRGKIIVEELREHFGLGATAPVSLNVEGAGKILVHGLPLDRNSLTVEFFTDVEVTLSAQDMTGTFVGWSDGEKSPTRVISPGLVSELTAIFK